MVTLERVRTGASPLAWFVDDDSSSCTGGVNVDGPGGVPYDCAGGEVMVPR